MISAEGSYVELQDYSLIPYLPPEKERCTFLICIQQFAEVGGPSNPHVNTNFVYLACEENVKKRLLFLWEWNQPVNQSKGKQKEVVSEKGVGSLDENETSMRGKYLDSDNIVEESRHADASWDAHMDSFEFSDPADIYNGKHPPLVISPSSVAEESIIVEDVEHEISSSGINFNADQESLTKDVFILVKRTPHGKISSDQDNEHSPLTESLRRRENTRKNRTLRSSHEVSFETPDERSCSNRSPKPMAQTRDLDPSSVVGPSSKSRKITGDQQRIEFHKKWPSDKIQQSILKYWKENRKLKKIDINERLRYLHNFNLKKL